MITLKDILSTKFYNDYGDAIELRVAGDPVWDFKTQNQELRLIHEPIPGFERFGIVTIGELKKELKLQEAEYPIVSETDTREIVEVEGIKKATKAGLNFILGNE